VREIRVSDADGTYRSAYVAHFGSRVSDLMRGKIERFSIDMLVCMAARAGLEPITIAA